MLALLGAIAIRCDHSNITARFESDLEVESEWASALAKQRWIPWPPFQRDAHVPVTPGKSEMSPALQRLGALQEEAMR